MYWKQKDAVCLKSTRRVAPRRYKVDRRFSRRLQLARPMEFPAMPAQQPCGTAQPAPAQPLAMRSHLKVLSREYVLRPDPDRPTDPTRTPRHARPRHARPAVCNHLCARTHRTAPPGPATPRPLTLYGQAGGQAGRPGRTHCTSLIIQLRPNFVNLSGAGNGSPQT